MSILQRRNKIFERRKPLSKSWSIVLQLKVLRLKIKLPCQKPMLRQIEYRVQNGPIIENEVLLIATLYLGTFV